MDRQKRACDEKTNQLRKNRSKKFAKLYDSNHDVVKYNRKESKKRVNFKLNKDKKVLISKTQEGKFKNISNEKVSKKTMTLTKFKKKESRMIKIESVNTSRSISSTNSEEEKMLHKKRQEEQRKDWWLHICKS